MGKLKYTTGESREVYRSEIKPAGYNPRTISKDQRDTLKRGIRKFGVVGGIVVNERTGMTLVGGHQRLSVLDELNKFNPETNENDYTLNVEVVDISEKEEKELNILLNNPNAQGQWDYDKLAVIVPEIDIHVAGLTDEDIAIIDIGTTFNIEAHSYSVDGDSPAVGQYTDENIDGPGEGEELSEEDTAKRIESVRDMKRQIAEGAQQKMLDNSAYITLSFSSHRAKEEFCREIGLNPLDTIVDGEGLMGLIYG